MKALVLAALLVGCFADTFTWVGSVNNLWRDPNNWSPFGLPTNVDDVVIPKGSVLIGNWHGAQAASLTIKGNGSLSVQGSELTIGTGGISITDTGFLHIAAGNDTISVAGTASVTSSRGVQYATGTIVGNWKFGAGAPLVFIEATSVKFPSIVTYGTITANLPHLNLFIDSLSVGQGGVATFANSQVYINDLHNDGSVTFASESVTLTKSDGKGQTTSTSSTLYGQYTNLFIPDSTSWITGTAVGLQISSGQTLQARDLRAFNSQGGIIKVFGELTIGASVALEGIQFDGGYGPSGTINVQSGTTGSVSWIHFNFPGTQYIGVEGPTTFKVKDLQQVQGELHVTSGILVADNVNASSTALAIIGGAELQVTSQLLVSSHIDLDGTLTIGTGATLTAAPSAHFAPRANSTGLRKINNNGVIFVQNGLTATTIQNLAYSGSGSIQVFGNLDLQAIDFAAASIALKSITSRITGEGLTLSYQTLSTPASGQTVNFFGDGSLSTCKSPCGPAASHFYQSVSIWVTA